MRDAVICDARIKHRRSEIHSPSYPESSFPLTSGRETSRQACAVRNEDSRYENAIHFVGL